MSDGPLRPVCALGTSPKGGGKMETGETNCRVAMTGRGTWLPLWGSWHGEAVTERVGEARRGLFFYASSPNMDHLLAPVIFTSLNWPRADLSPRTRTRRLPGVRAVRS